MLRVFSVGILVVSIFYLSACATNENRELKTKLATAQYTESAPLQVIDTHMHTRFSGGETDYGGHDTKDQWLLELKKAGVVGGVSHNAKDADLAESLNQYGVMHCYGVSAKPNLAKLEQGLKSKTFGCIKVYLGYEYQWANHPNYLAVYKLAEKYDATVVFHTGDTLTADGKVKYADPLTIDEIAVDFRKVNFVIAHCGNPWWQSAAEVAYKNPNVYLECSAFLIGDLSKKDPASVDELMVKPIAWIFRYLENPKKMMFGTDWPLVSINDYLKAYKKAIPPEHWQAVFHDNAVRVFHLDRLDRTQNQPTQ
jgi:uncharacterized protein